MNLRSASGLLTLAFLTWLCCSLASPLLADPPELSGIKRTAYFTVRYDPEDPYLAVLISETAQEELVRISRDLGYRLEKTKPFELRVYRAHRDFIDAGGLDARKFTVGTASAADQSISVDASGAFVTAKEVLAHEITHAVVFRILGHSAPALPLWFNEGLAKYESQADVGQDDVMVANAAADGTLIPLGRLQSEFPEKRDALAYAESYSAVRYLVKTRGKSAPRLLLEEMARTGSFDAAMEVAAGKTADQFASDWFHEVSSRYWVLRAARIAGALGGVLMAALAVVAFLMRRKRMRQAAEAWEQEEFDAALRRQSGNDWWR